MDDDSTLDIIFIVFGAVKLLILYSLVKILWKYLLKPYWTVKFYRSQGGVGFFGFGVDYMLKSQEDMFKEKDWYFW